MESIIKKFAAAKKKGLKLFYAHCVDAIHYTVQFVGRRWEDGELVCDRNGKPIRHYSRTSRVVGYGVQELDPTDHLQWQTVEEWWNNNSG